MRTGALVAAGGALGLWLGDVPIIFPLHATTTWSRWLTGMGGALFVALTTALVLGAIVGPLAAPTTDRVSQRLVAFRASLASDPNDTIHAASAWALAAFVVVPVAFWLAYHASLIIPGEFARASSIALVLAFSHVALAVALIVTWPLAVYVARAVVDLIARVPGLRSILLRVWTLPLFLLLSLAGVAAFLLQTYWLEVRTLPWREGEPLGGLLVGLAAAGLIAKASRPWVHHAGLAVLAASLLFGGIEASRIHPESTTARKLGFEDALSGRAGYAAWSVAFDFDGDGQLGMLGGGDCAPFDARRHMGAVDIPMNGIDEDCDGIDQALFPIRARPRIPVGQSSLATKPTLILITVDGLAARKLMTLGGPKSLMPNVEALAASGALFTEAFSEGPSTRLSFPSMFTSHWDSQLRQEYSITHPYPLAASERQMQDTLDAAGYETIAVVPAGYFTPRRWSSVTRGFQRLDASALHVPKHNAPAVTDAAIRILAEPATRPRYMWIHYYDAHGPYLPIPGVSYANTSEESLYEAELTYIDQSLGRLFAAIDQRADPTYVFFTADHGSVFSTLPGHRHHYGDDLNTATLHVPLIIKGPGISPRRVDGLASTMDILPTITDLLGIPDKPEAEGQSLWPEMLAGRTDGGRALFHEIYLGERDFQGHDPLEQVSVRDATWDLILDRKRASYHLFDYARDYQETRDLYEDQGKSPHALRMKRLLGTFVEEFHRRTPGTAIMPSVPDER